MSAKFGSEINITFKQPDSPLSSVIEEKLCAGLPMLCSSPAGSAEGLINTLQRLEQVIDLETKTLLSRQPITLQDFNHKKIYGLLELIRLVTIHEANPPAPEIEIGMSRLRKKLETNLSVLHMHLTAIREISAIIANAIKEHESDGTYSGQMGEFGALR